MKKIIFLMWICMLFLSACQKEEPDWTNRGSDLQITEIPLKTAATEADKEPPKKDTSEYIDCTAIIKSFIQPAPDEEVIDVGGRILCWIPPTTVVESCAMAENVVAGTVLDLTYCDEGGEAKTFYSFAVTDVWKGSDIEEESIITVLEFQGYQRLSEVGKLYEKQGYHNWFSKYSSEEKERTYQLFTYVHEPLVQVGDAYILFLGGKENWDNEDYIDGDFFMLPAMYAGKYVRNEEGFYEQFFEYGDRDYYGKTDETTGNFVLFEPWKTFDEMKSAVLEAVESEK